MSARSRKFHLCNHCITEAPRLTVWLSDIQCLLTTTYEEIHRLHRSLRELLGPSVGELRPHGGNDNRHMDSAMRILCRADRAEIEAEGLIAAMRNFSLRCAYAKAIAPLDASRISFLHHRQPVNPILSRVAPCESFDTAERIHETMLPGTYSGRSCLQRLPASCLSIQVDECATRLESCVRYYEGTRDELYRVVQEQRVAHLAKNLSATFLRTHVAKFVRGLELVLMTELEPGDLCGICKQEFLMGSSLSHDDGTESFGPCVPAAEGSLRLREPVVRLTCKGRHVFDAECITAWLKGGHNRACPMDREKLF